jgi:hypothetical protein
VGVCQGLTFFAKREAFIYSIVIAGGAKKQVFKNCGFTPLTVNMVFGLHVFVLLMNVFNFVPLIKVMPDHI